MTVDDIIQNLSKYPGSTPVTIDGREIQRIDFDEAEGNLPGRIDLI